MPHTFFPPFCCACARTGPVVNLYLCLHTYILLSLPPTHPHKIKADKSLNELRQLYFKLKDEVFGKSRASVAYNTEALERILKKELGDQRMSDVKYPRYIMMHHFITWLVIVCTWNEIFKQFITFTFRVLIPAVRKDFINLKLHFFNNCFGDEFSNGK